MQGHIEKRELQKEIEYTQQTKKFEIKYVNEVLVDKEISIYNKIQWTNLMKYI